jgi:hypothetical protein
MGTLSLEIDKKVNRQRCHQCGFEYPRVHGFVYDDGNALAVYWAALYVDHPEHPEPRADLTIAIGADWGAESGVTTRSYAELEVWVADEEVRMRFHDVNGRPLDTKAFGAPLSRAAALASPLRQKFLRVADQIVYDDPRVRAVLGTKP